VEGVIKNKKKEMKEIMLETFISAFAVCNNLKPVIDDPDI
jgi:hypothetical protein